MDAKTALKEAYEKRKTRLKDGSGGELPLWKPPENVSDLKQANDDAGDTIGPAVADGQKFLNVIPAFRQANMLLAMARDHNASSRERITRGGEYIMFLNNELNGGLDARIVK